MKAIVIFNKLPFFDDITILYQSKDRALDKGHLFFRKYDAFFSLPKKCAENYPEKEILKLRSV